MGKKKDESFYLIKKTKMKTEKAVVSNQTEPSTDSKTKHYLRIRNLLSHFCLP